jgi:hypothetical protein
MASVLKVDKLDPQSGTALELGTSGDTITVPTGAGLTVTDEVKTNKVSPASGTAFALGDSGDTFTIPSGATLDISASTLTPPATMPASSGINFTALNATNLGSGTVPTARLGTGTASSSTVLYGDQTYKTEPGGQILATAFGTFNTETSTTATSYGTGVTGATATLTTVNDNAKILCLSMVAWMHANSDSGMMTLLYSVDSAADALAFTGTQTGNGSDANMGIRWGFDYSPATECYINQETHSSTAGETIAYKQVFWCYPSSAQTLYINRAAVAPSAYKAAAAICTIQLFELA